MMESSERNKKISCFFFVVFFHLQIHLIPSLMQILTCPLIVTDKHCCGGGMVQVEGPELLTKLPHL